MFQRLAIIALSIAATSGAYFAYAWMIAPLIDPPPKTVVSSALSDEEIQKAIEETEKRRRERFAPYFREGDWELQSPKVVEGERVAMLMRDYKPLADGKIELKPCTLLFFPEGRTPTGGKTARAMILQAPEGAELQFDNTLDVRRGQIGNLQGGRLIGAVTIRCPESAPGAADDLEIATQNVQMTLDKLLTPHEVTFRYGKSYGSGRDLTISLLSKAEASAADPEAGAVSGGIRSVELVHVDKVHMEMTPVAKTMVKQPASTSPMGAPGTSLLGLPVAENRAEAATARLPVEITCRGPFSFDALKRLASFEDNVDVLRIHPDGLTDQLQCKVLEIQFAAAGQTAGLPGDPGRKSDKNPSPEPIGEGKTSPGFMKRALPPLAVELVRALGQPVVLRVPSYALEARGDRLEYDFRSKSLRLDAQGQAELKQGAHVIRTPGLEYTLDESGDPNQLGKLWSAGPGKWTGTYGVEKPTNFTIEWAKQLVLRPHEGYQVASLTDRATVMVAGTGRLDADELHVWIKKLETSVAPPDGRADSPSYASAAPSKQPQLKVEKILGKRNIQFDSQQLAGGAQQLEIWLQGDLGAGPIKTVPTAPAPQAMAAGPTYPVAPRQPMATAPGPNSPMQPAAPPQKMHVASDLIRVLLASVGGETVVEGATLEGGFKVTEIQTPRVGDQPVSIIGRSAQFSGGRSPATSTITLLGSPAEINARGYGLSGDKVFVHRGESRATVEGPGKMLLPAQRDLTGQAAAGGQTFAVEWKDGLKFDGRTLACEHGVTIRGQTQTATCDWLEAQLNRPIDMLAAEMPRDVQLGRVVLHEVVDMENRTSDAQGQLAVDRMHVRDLVIDQLTGEIASAPQPGWMTTVRRGNPQLKKPGAGNAPMQPVPGGQNGLSYMRVDFQSGLIGNLVKHEVKFLNQVRAVYGPVADWNATIDPNSPQGLADAVTLNCDQLAVVELPISPVEKTIELQASGNTIVEGKGFTARCARMAYTQAKDLLVLEGDGRADAELTRREPGRVDARAAAAKILFWKTANQVQVDGARVLDLLNLGPQPAARPAAPGRR